LQPPAAEIRAAIEAAYGGSGHAVVLSDRSDLFAFYPYFGFIQWNANYSHPTARYHDRLSFLRDLAKVGTPVEFAQRTGKNEFDSIDAIVLKIDGESLHYVTYDDDFPFGTKAQHVLIPRRLIQPEQFNITTSNGYLVAVRK
jgi:galactan 5-O-arabinofuranosyltransferase